MFRAIYMYLGLSIGPIVYWGIKRSRCKMYTVQVLETVTLWTPAVPGLEKENGNSAELVITKWR